ncbi:MAG: FadR family transcriptional regulator [Clostridia bacterium]|nr:FadR family transcriptional regulator [Clostridia bacterium]
MSGTLSNSVAESIKLKIKSGEYRADEKLPNEQELSVMMGVSRPTIREAVKLLVSKNIVRIERGKGTFVNPDPGTAEDSIGLEFIPEDVIVRDLREFRYYVEPFVAKLAAEHASRGQISGMREIVGKMLETAKYAKTPETHAEGYRQMCNYELLFHGSMYEMSGNNILKRLKPAIMKSVLLYYFKGEDEETYDLELAYRNHRNIYEAIRKHDAEAAYRRTVEHMLKP